ncbi:hypothetical protein [Micromonospora sp. CV4]|uniref:hypothetical protein n=1 Tax=Micromonospora sp. CV4 TaxID=2478711 RepID=UPI0011C3E2CC|nr:hypothetical protein [Micromonospora sp. CV4]
MDSPLVGCKDPGMASTPDWATLLTALSGSLVGGLFTFAGVAWSQRATRERELTIDRMRHSRDKADRLRETRRQLLVDMAEYVEDRQAWYDNMENGAGGAADLAKLTLHPNQLTGRVKLYAPPVLQQLWVTLIAANATIVWNIDLGNYQQDEWGGGALDDSTCVPRAQAAADLMTAGIRAALSDEGSEVLGLDDAEARLIAEVSALPTHPHRKPNDELIAEIRAEAFNRLRTNAG